MKGEATRIIPFMPEVEWGCAAIWEVRYLLTYFPSHLGAHGPVERNLKECHRHSGLRIQDWGLMHAPGCVQVKRRHRGDVVMTWTFFGQCCKIPSHAAYQKVAVVRTVVASIGVPTSSCCRQGAMTPIQPSTSPAQKQAAAMTH